MIGLVGRFLIITGFVACVLSCIAYIKATRKPQEREQWIRTGRLSWYVMFACILVASGLLSYLLFTHSFEYHYVWRNTSRSLPNHFLFSSLWAGQEGSLMLWAIMGGGIGLGALAWSRSWEPHVMAVLAFSHLFMLSMILGIQIGPLTIGSQPFGLLVDQFPDNAMLQAGIMPVDGQGLNDLLQNGWMVIHPPTLFMGFSLMAVPFAFAIAGLWRRQYTAWVRPALPWTLCASLILISGIVMGGYWAYVTLSFGGYWAWDPVENSSFVPWLILIGGLHSMISQKRSGANQKAAIILSIVGYMLVIYSTFLTRSGILGDVSVHSFVDLGLYNQLLIWILAIAGLGFGAFFYRYKELPSPNRTLYVLSREFLIFSGAMLLAALGFVIILGTSTPIFGRLFLDNPSGVPLEFYNNWSLPITIAIALLVGLGQLFWWNKMKVDDVNRVLLKPLVWSVASTGIILIVSRFGSLVEDVPAVAAPSVVEASVLTGMGGVWEAYGTALMMALLLFTSFFGFYGNGMVLWRIGRGNMKLAGGAIAHIGFVLMIFGIITSSGFSNPIAGEETAPKFDENGAPLPARDNFILERGQTVAIEGYKVTYASRDFTPEGRPRYQLEFTDHRDRNFTLEPVAYKGSTGQWVQHPDIKKYFERDVYTSIAPGEMYEEESESAQQEPGKFSMRRGETKVLGLDEYEIAFDAYDLDVDPGLVSPDAQISVAAVLRVTEKKTGETETLRPVYMVMKDGRQEFIETRVPEWGIAIAFAGMDVSDGSAHLLVQGVEVQARDWLVVQTYEKPFINLLWWGTFLMCGGFFLAMGRRISDQKDAERRGVA